MIANGKLVVSWTGAMGVVEYQTADGWYGVRQQSGRIDEWQGWQLTVV